MSVERTRKTRKTVTRETIKNVINYISKEFTLRQIAEEEDISLGCAKSLVDKITAGKTVDEILSAKKGRPTKNFRDQSLLHSEIIDEDKMQTQISMQENLRRRDIYLSQPTISRVIKSMNYSLKAVVKIPAERNSVSNITMRQVYARYLALIPDENLVFLDETGFNLHLIRQRGYSQKKHTMQCNTSSEPRNQ
jgi:transposase